ncbi:MAG TPA: alpha/beta fold hydrolase [Ktedonobacterales bacterium]|nr:alpha/beta fold hydrolase [Ktedonobacterales bacterium]
MDQINIEGLRIAYQHAGKGPPLVLLHGAYCDSRVWRPQLDGLSDEFTVVAWDAPGFGRSSDPPETFRLSDWADCLAAFIAALELGRPHVLGLSLGSLFALGLYGRYPDVPGSLVLASAYAGWGGSLPPEMVQQRLQRALRETEQPPEQWVPGWIPELLTANAPAGAANEVAAMMFEFHPAAARTTARALAEEDLRDILPGIRVPTLLLYGSADVRSPLPVAEDLHARIPGSRLAVMPGIGHLSNIDAPDLFNAEVRAFLRSVRS